MILGPFDSFAFAPLCGARAKFFRRCYNTIMLNLFLIIIGVGAGIWFGFFLGRRSALTGARAINEKRHQEKEEAKERILVLLKDKTDVTNDEIESFLGISDATATRYLEELEKEDLIMQIGVEGTSVKYRLK